MVTKLSRVKQELRFLNNFIKIFSLGIVFIITFVFGVLSIMDISDIEEQIKKIEDEIFNTQKNKATEHHIGKLKAKIARLKQEVDKRKSTGVKGKGFSIKKQGDAYEYKEAIVIRTARRLMEGNVLVPEQYF